MWVKISCQSSKLILFQLKISSVAVQTVPRIQIMSRWTSLHLLRNARKRVKYTVAKLDGTGPSSQKYFPPKESDECIQLHTYPQSEAAVLFSL